MIIEFCGLPGSGKSTLAKKIEANSDFQIVKIKNRRELVFYNFIFLIKHPSKFFAGLYYIFVYSCSRKDFYLKLMNLFLQHNAKFQKAGKYKKAIIDQGYYQNIISLFNEEKSDKEIIKYAKNFLKPDKLIFFDIDNKLRIKRLEKRINNPRKDFSQEYLDKWHMAGLSNSQKLKDNLKNLEVEYVIINDNSEKEFDRALNFQREKIKYIINARIPTEKAHGYQISRMCMEFSRLGVDTKMIIPARSNPIKKDLFSYYGLSKNFKFKEIKSIDFLKYAKYIKKMAYWLQTFFYLGKLLLLKIEKGSLVYTRNPEIAWLFKKRGFKTAYECHDWFGRNKKISLLFLKETDFIISTNRFIQAEFIKHGFKQEKLLTAPNGIDLEIFNYEKEKNKAIEELDINQETKDIMIKSKVLLYTGSFTTMGEDKGIKEILESIKIIDGEIFFLAVGGSEEDIEKYSFLAEKMDAKIKTKFLSRVTQEELALFQKAADILLMPFPDKVHYKFFMAPLKMFEYMAGGRPIIASDLPSIREVLNIETAVFCRPGDSKDLAEKIKLLITDKNLSRKISENALIQVKQYAWKNRAEKIINFINKKNDQR